MTTKILRGTSLFLIFVTLFICLYVNNGLFFPFITGKAFIFRIIVEMVFALWLALMTFDKKYAPKFSKLSITITVFTFAILVADLLGANPIRSLWSNFERMEGWVTIIHLWGYFLAMTSIFGADGYEAGRRMWHKFFKTSLIASTLVGLYGVFQLAGWAEVHQGSTRIDASLGNAEYMALYMLMHTFIAIYMAYVERARAKTKLFWMYIVYSVFCAFLVFETATRGSILALIGGVMLILGIQAVFGKGESKKSRWISAGVIVGMILLGVLFYANRDAKFIQNNETLRRMASISINDTKSQARAYIWPMAIKGAFSSPKTAIIGWGQENFNYIFNANYDPEMWRHEQWFDRAHSVPLDWLVAGGLVGLILYLALFVLSLIAIWKSSLTFIEKSVLTGMLGAYFVHSIFVFDNLVSYILFFTILGFFHSLSIGRPMKWLERRDRETENSMVVRGYLIIPAIVVAFGASLYLVNIRPIQANTRLIDAMIYCSGGNNVVPTAALYARALELNQYVANQEIREQLLTCSNNVSRSSLSETIKKSFSELIIQELSNQLYATPKDARAFVLAGSYFNSIGAWETGQAVLEKAHALSPNKQTITFELATNYLNSKKEKEAEALLEKAYNDAPENDTSAFAYASALVVTGQEAKAKKLFADKPEIFMDQRMANVYVRLKRYDKVIEIEKELVKQNPGDVNLHASLAGAYFGNGQIQMAIAELQDMIVKFPSYKDQIEETIKQIQAGKNVIQ